ncbi:cytoplasmic dynein 1 light intermediate chain 1-like isoform X2 [Anopheles merus]|uniref:cytoplasmic dynein 1 light intermediate chain 1-like isoform X2 n=1 Tax=Anopheles merus TaxID=30066 RepID=UPI001BE40F2E|nr:cytoplasmic dynein 1 light intermediate chain 1-like isoform X2 [Anopheles merus]
MENDFWTTLLGDTSCDSSTLIAKLKGCKASTAHRSGLQYDYLQVHDEYREESTRLSIWTLAADPELNGLLKFALNECTFPHTLILLTLSIAAPWTWMDQLQYWMKVLDNHIGGLVIDAELKHQCKARLMAKWQRYSDPASDPHRISPCKWINEPVPLPLEDAVLTSNFGMEVMVVVTRSDQMATLRRELNYREDHFDFMQQAIRRACLQYGASLAYTSAKNNINCDLLFQYLKHRIYGLPFGTSASVVEKDAVFIPAGWDSVQKISILHESLYSCKPDDDYNSVIAQPSRGKYMPDCGIQTVDEQEFFARLQQELQEDAETNEPLTRTSIGTGTPQRTSESADKDMQAVEKKSGGVGGVLADFFNTLMLRRSFGGGDRPVEAE